MKTLLLFLITTSSFAQLHLTGGFTNIAKRTDGNTLNFSVGYSQEVKDFRIRASYGRILASGLKYDNVSAHITYRLHDTAYRLEFGAGASWNDVDYNIDPSLILRNAIEIDNGLYVTVDFEQIIKRPGISHLHIGFLVDIDWKNPPKNKPRFF